MAKTILGIGAHNDDCVFGIPGILLKAVRKNFRVVIVSLIGDYSNWKPSRGREREILAGSIALAREYGVEMRFLDFAGMKFSVNEESKRRVAEAVADISPEIAFTLWPHDHHPDHEVASELSKVALRYGDRLLPPDAPFTPPRQVYWFDNGPGHTINFTPDTFVDVSDEWPQAIAWLGRLMAVQQGKDYDPSKLTGAQLTKEAIALYRGQTCGVKYAEALRATGARAQEIF